MVLFLADHFPGDPSYLGRKPLPPTSCIAPVSSGRKKERVSFVFLPGRIGSFLCRYGAGGRSCGIGPSSFPLAATDGSIEIEHHLCRPGKFIVASIECHSFFLPGVQKEMGRSGRTAQKQRTGTIAANQKSGQPAFSV